MEYLLDPRVSLQPMHFQVLVSRFYNLEKMIRIGTSDHGSVQLEQYCQKPVKIDDTFILIRDPRFSVCKGRILVSNYYQ